MSNLDKRHYPVGSKKSDGNPLNRRHHWVVDEIKPHLDAEKTKITEADRGFLQGTLGDTFKKFGDWLKGLVKEESLSEAEQKIDTKIKKEIKAFFAKVERLGAPMHNLGGIERVRVQTDMFNLHVKVNYPHVYADKKRCTRLMEEIGILPADRMSL